VEYYPKEFFAYTYYTNNKDILLSFSPSLGRERKKSEKRKVGSLLVLHET